MAVSESAMSPNSESVSAADPGSQRRKRRRIAVACAECRAKKSRCDGERPQCSLCASQGISCNYAQPLLPSGNLTHSKALFDRIESRLAQLESEVRILRQAEKAGDGLLEDDRGGPPRSHPGRHGISSHHDEAYEGASPDTTDGIGSIEFTDVPNSGYFGPSSNIHFIRNMRRALAAVLSDVPQPANGTQAESDLYESARNQNMLQVSRPQSPVRRSRPTWPGAAPLALSARSLPPEAEVQTLLHRYFFDTGLLFPYIHVDSFYKTYNEVKASRFRRARRSWMGLLYAILAMATTTSAEAGTSVEQRAANADVFFTRAEELCLSDTLNGAGVETVQALLLISQFLQGTNRSVQTWSIHGLAVKSALQLGLHSDEFSKRCDPLEQEIRKRTWFGCVLLDRTLSMTFGRPASIPDYYVKLSLPRHRFHLESDANLSPWAESESSTMFFNATITLYKIMGRALDLLYDSNLGGMPSRVIVDLISAILELEHELLDWRSTLPAPVRLLDHEELLNADAHPDTRLRLILTLRYHNVRILVHRPVLDYYLEQAASRGAPLGAAGSPIPPTTIPQASRRSVAILSASAECIIKMVSTVNDPSSNKRHLLGAWWFSLYYTLNAALTVASIVVCQNSSLAPLPLVSDVSTSISTPTGGRSFQDARALIEQANACLPRLDTGNRIVEKCASLTRVLCSCVSFLMLVRGGQPENEQLNGTRAGQVPDMDSRGESFPPGDLAQNAQVYSWNLFSTDMNLNYGVDLATFMSGMTPQDQELAPMDDVYYW